jgi:hypothetical protein
MFIQVKDWTDIIAEKYRLNTPTRFGLGITRSNAVAKMTGIKTTLR